MRRGRRGNLLKLHEHAADARRGRPPWPTRVCRPRDLHKDDGTRLGTLVPHVLDNLGVLRVVGELLGGDHVVENQHPRRRAEERRDRHPRRRAGDARGDWRRGGAGGPIRRTAGATSGGGGAKASRPARPRRRRRDRLPDAAGPPVGSSRGAPAAVALAGRTPPPAGSHAMRTDRVRSPTFIPFRPAHAAAAAAPPASYSKNAYPLERPVAGSLIRLNARSAPYEHSSSLM